MRPIRLAWLNLVRRRVPAVIALVAIALSVATSGVLFKLYLLSGSRFSTMAGGVDAVVGAKAGGTEILLGSLNTEGAYPGFLPYKLFQSLRERRAVRFEDGVRTDPAFLRAVIPFVYFGQVGRHRIVGTDESFIHRPDPVDSPALATGRWMATSGETVVGADVARAEGLKLGDTLSAVSWTGDPPDPRPLKFDLKIVGMLRRTGTVWDGTCFATVEQAHQILEQVDLRDRSLWGSAVLNYFLVCLEPGGMPALESLINGRTVGQVVEVGKEKRRLAELTGTGRRLGFLVTALILLLGGLSVAAMMVTRFDAMTVQLAVLRAIGYGRREVARWLVWEGLILGFSACVIGGALDGLVFPWLRGLLGAALPSRDLLACPVCRSAPVWAAAVIATVLAVLIPLYRLYRQDIHSALRGL